MLSSCACALRLRPNLRLCLAIFGLLCSDVVVVTATVFQSYKTDTASRRDDLTDHDGLTDLLRFLHYPDSDPLSLFSDLQKDPVVQSPRTTSGASSTALHAEAAAEAALHAALLVPGARVQLQQLKARPDLNGIIGTLQSFDEGLGRWSVLYADPQNPKKEGGSIRPENLLPVPATNELGPAAPVPGNETASEDISMNAGDTPRRDSPAPRTEHRTALHAEAAAEAALHAELLVPGARVQLQQLRARHLNGIVGTLRSFDEKTGRWSVVYEDPQEGMEGGFIRPQNLLPVPATNEFDEDGMDVVAEERRPESHREDSIADPSEVLLEEALGLASAAVAPTADSSRSPESTEGDLLESFVEATEEETGGFEEETGAAEEEILDVLLDVGLDVAGDAVSSFPTGTIFPVEEVFVHRKHRKGPAHRAAFSSFLNQVEFRLSF